MPKGQKQCTGCGTWNAGPNTKACQSCNQLFPLGCPARRSPKHAAAASARLMPKVSPRKPGAAAQLFGPGPPAAAARHEGGDEGGLDEEGPEYGESSPDSVLFGFGSSSWRSPVQVGVFTQHTGSLLEESCE
jgi:hypothetical protein